MKSSAEIRFDFQNARLQADRLEALAAELPGAAQHCR